MVSKSTGESQSEKNFIEDLLEADTEGSFVPMADLKEAYSIYCKENGLYEKYHGVYVVVSLIPLTQVAK